MRKIKTALVSILAFTALAASWAGICFADEISAQAETAEPKTELLSPTSYEEYLSLENPSSTAVTEEYTAIADGEVIYLYDRATGNYRRYEHEQSVTKLQFSDMDTLYFLDGAIQLHSLDPETLTATKLNFACNTFFIAGDDLFFTIISGEASGEDGDGGANIYQTDLYAPTVPQTPIVKSLSASPAITVWNDDLYYTNAGHYLHKVSVDSPALTAPIGYFSELISSIVVSDGILGCTTFEGKFFTHALPQIGAESLLFEETNGYATVSAHGGYFYVIRKTNQPSKYGGVRQFSLTDNAFTGYEICARSTSQNRIDGGTALHLDGDALYIADDLNDRISVYDTITQTFQTPIPSALSAKYLTADDGKVLAANETQAILYDGADVYSYDFTEHLVGTASVYGKFYFITENNHCFVLSQTDGAWQLSGVAKPPKYTTHLTSDAYGYLYTAHGNDIYRFTEEEFLSPTAEGEKYRTDLPERTAKLHVDYAGEVYALQDKTVVKLGAAESYDFSASLVYTPEITPVSFAFGIKENQTYVLYQENYIVATEKLCLPTVKTIPVSGVDKQIFAPESAEFSVVQTKPNALVVSFDIETLDGAEYFPYLSHSRKSEAMTALKIGETEQYNVLAVFDETAQKYDVYLALTSLCTPLADYRTDYAENARAAAYLSSEVYLYKFPYLTELLTVSRLARGTKITLLGEIDKLDHAYYHVSYTAENGETQTGYIPKAYVNLFDGTPPTPEQAVYGSTNSNKDALYRLVYLILGFGAICILTDFLILRKHEKEE
ncbi:MAG: hypothetical protein IJZ32_00885 [Clostridia bacterium]|nr:hypothetical protein [Clostridia bacterium]